MKSKIAIIGAGPIGIEAALYASVQGHDVAVYENDCVGASLLEWGHVRLFSPWAMNVSPLGLSVLGQRALPAAEDLITGRDFVEAYLRPLSETAELEGKIFEGVRVVQVGRDRLTRTDLIGDSTRRRHPFRLLLSEREGRERIDEAEVVIDASGVWRNPNYCGNGNIPAPGERRHRDRISYRLENFDDPAVARKYADGRILVVGGGHSAATTIWALDELIRHHPRTQVVWVNKRGSVPPFAPRPDDPLPFRAEVLRRANEIAAQGRGVQFRAGTVVEAIEPGTDRPLRVSLRGESGITHEELDYIIAHCGFGPDNSLYRELQVLECWATRGPMKLASALLGQASADCLAQTTHGGETLTNPEPGFFIVGIKSYGKLSNFLLKIGREQLDELFRLIEKEEVAAPAVA